MIGAGAIGVATTLAFATPAFACHPTATYQKACNDQGLAVITWTVQLDDGSGGTIKDFKVTPDGSTWSGDELATDTAIQAGKSLTFVQTLKEGESTASLNVQVQIGKSKVWINNGPVTANIECSPPQPSQSAQPSPSEQTPSVSPSESAQVSESAAPATSSSSEESSLPVTGTSTSIIAAVAIVLVGAGAALFVMARRRRVKFTA